MRNNWVETNYMPEHRVNHLAVIYIRNPYVGVVGRWYCPKDKVEEVVEKVKKFIATKETKYEIHIARGKYKLNSK